MGKVWGQGSEDAGVGADAGTWGEGWAMGGKEVWHLGAWVLQSR